MAAKLSMWALVVTLFTTGFIGVNTAEPALVTSGSSDTTEATPTPPANDTWGTYDPGTGFLVARTSFGELSISAYGLLRYINQMPPSQTYTDHLGNERQTDGRQDIYPHRVIVWLKGWMYDPKLVYYFTAWTVNATDQDALFLQCRLPVQPPVQPLRGHHRERRVAFDARLAPVLARS
jgi:hypothetical protein